MRNNIKILLVDDEEGIRKILREVLKVKGFIIEEAKNGEEALEKVSKNKPDLIILDYHMPGLNGWEVYKLLKERKTTRNIPVIILSGYTSLKEKLFSSVDIEYIEKPCEIKELLNKINKFLKL